MSAQSSLRLLQHAIETVRESCTGDQYKQLLSAVDTADSEAEKILGEPDDTSADRKVEQQPKSLKTAATAAKAELASRRTNAS